MAETPLQLDDGDRAILRDLLEFYEGKPSLPTLAEFRVRHEAERGRIDRLKQDRLLTDVQGGYVGLTTAGVRACESPDGNRVLSRISTLLEDMKRAYRERQGQVWTAADFGNFSERSSEEVWRLIGMMTDVPGFSTITMGAEGFPTRFALTEAVLDIDIPAMTRVAVAEAYDGVNEANARALRLEVTGYRPFRGLDARLRPLTVLVGANATGKSSLFGVLRLLSFAASDPLPVEIDPHLPPGARLFHAGVPERLEVALTADLGDDKPVRYEVEITGPVGAVRVARERLATSGPLVEGAPEPFAYLDFRMGRGVVVNDAVTRLKTRASWSLSVNELALRRAIDPNLRVASRLQAYLTQWRFFSGFDVGAGAAIRQPAIVEEEPLLKADGSNLSAVLHDIVLSHADVREELESMLVSAVPGFVSLSARTRGRGQAIVVWREHGVDGELTLADLSDGTLRLLAWLTLATAPRVSPMICIDEPETGLHPRVLPVLAGAFKIASSRTQLLIATHSPYFLSQFALQDVAVLRKEEGRAIFVRPADRDALRREIEEIGSEAIAWMHISDELEVRA